MKKITTSILIAAIFFAATKIAAQNANTSLSNLNATTKINSDLLPDGAASRNLGSATKSWTNIYLKGSLYIDKKKFISNPGSYNNFIGTLAGNANTIGSYNTGVGYNALYTNTSGVENTALGYSALYSNNTGGYNTAIGESALSKNTSGSYNSAIGKDAMYYNTTGNQNAASGYFALGYNTTGSYNTASGYGALELSAAGVYNTASGYMALYNNANSYNTAHGAYALTSNSSGYDNTATGVSALYHNTTGTSNTADGLDALSGNTTGIDNTASGANALNKNNTGSYNTAIGVIALVNTTASEGNTALGYNAGATYDNGYYNVFVGANTDVNGADYYNDIAIGQGTICTAPSQVTMGNSATNSYRAYANWSNISDGRFKKNIKQNVPGLAFINKLQPITYTLDATGIDNFLHNNQTKDKKVSEQAKASISNALTAKEKILYTGFVAQDVEKAAKSLNYDFSGVDAAKNSKDLYGLRYSDFVVPLVKAVQELSKMNNAKDSVINNLETRLSKLEALMNTSNSTVNSQQATVVSSALLQQNAPNPFSHSTNISYSIPQKFASAKIIITDKNGNTLKQINLPAGRQGVTGNKGNILVDASALASGAYQYSLIVDGKIIDTKQMIAAK